MTDTPDEKPKKRRAPRRRKPAAPPAMPLPPDKVSVTAWKSLHSLLRESAGRAPSQKPAAEPATPVSADEIAVAAWQSLQSFGPEGYARAPVKRSPWPPPLPPLSDEDVSLAAMHALRDDGYLHAPVKRPPLWRRAVGYLILALVLPLVVACVVVGAVEWTLQSCGHWMLDVRERIDPECAP